MSGVQLLDPLFTGLDEGIDGGAVAAGHGSEDGSVNDPFVGFCGGRGVEGGKVFQRPFRVSLRPWRCCDFSLWEARRNRPVRSVRRVFGPPRA